MSKYEKLWIFIKNGNKDEPMVSFDEIKKICGFEINHSFLNAKKELKEFGYEVVKISMKEKTISFKRTTNVD